MDLLKTGVYGTHVSIPLYATLNSLRNEIADVISHIIVACVYIVDNRMYNDGHLTCKTFSYSWPVELVRLVWP